MLPHDRVWTRPTAEVFRAEVFLALICLILTAGCGSQESVRVPPGPPTALLDRWVEMWNSYDLDEVTELFLDDPSLTYFSSEKQGSFGGWPPLSNTIKDSVLYRAVALRELAFGLKI